MDAQLTVLLDACVLYPAPLRDFLMRLALTGVVRARWTAHIHEEWIRNAIKNQPQLTRERLEKTAALMNQAIEDSLISHYEPLITGLTLPDENDRHVLAAAIKGNAQVIVTFNLKDFPSSHLAPFEIEALHPDNFISHLIENYPEAVLLAAREQRRSLKKPPKTVEEFLDTLLRQQLPSTVSYLNQHRELI
ncbi:MAG: PIN domain-containing protein [Thiofilum sp.]|uniref:PIN domain-containing protein n=1 Tax=Thiofilum sp. TaxID=2212733 RepID=UPI0025D2046C|nr:PIN domain-containing protein [Thiofilum sp.]MBK8451753.1 PIN domain-containing protein [Thiofilum sp.]